ncbi:hypothetical protein OSTOST_15384 [Ostertagia ostertagi]
MRRLEFANPLGSATPLSALELWSCPEEVDINLNDPQVGEAAKKIQNVFRSKKLDKKSNAAAEVANGSTGVSG